jgi:hypothetical protein
MNKGKWFPVIVLILCFIAGGLQMTPAAAKAKAKPKSAVKANAKSKIKVVAGGQNQLKGMEGNIGDWLFNGTTKLRITNITTPDVGPRGEKPDEGMRWFVISVELKNASDMNANYGGSAENLTLVDADEQTIKAGRLKQSKNWDEDQGDMILPAAGMKGVIVVAVPVDYKPIRLVYQHGSSDPVFRIKF